MSRERTSLLLFVLALQLSGLLYFSWFLWHHGHLPSSFVFEKNDTFMDLYHALFWANNSARYTEWKSVYPPLNFIFLKLVNFIFLGNASASNGFDLRDAAHPVTVFFLCTYLAIPAFVLKSKLWSQFTSIEKIIFYFIIILSTPMLFVLERGNLIIFSLAFLALILNSDGLIRAFWLALLINLKPYFAVLLLYYLVRHDWRGFWKCTLISTLLFATTGLLLDEHFLYFFINLFSFSQSTPPFSTKTALALSSSISVFSYVLNEEAIKQSSKYSQHLNLHVIGSLIDFIKWLVLTWTVAELFKNQNRLSDNQIIAVLLVIISNFGIWVGGYSLIFYVAILPVFLGMKSSSVYMLILNIMILPIDFIPLAKSISGEQFSYLTNSTVDVYWTLGLGNIFKPVLNFILLAVLLQEIRRKNDNTQRKEKLVA